MWASFKFKVSLFFSEIVTTIDNIHWQRQTWITIFTAALIFGAVYCMRGYGSRKSY